MEYVIVTDNGDAFNEMDYSFSSIDSNLGFSTYDDPALAVRIATIIINMTEVESLKVVDAQKYIEIIESKEV